VLVRPIDLGRGFAIFDHCRRYGGVKYLKKIEGLIGLAEELKGIEDADRTLCVERKI
jgi:hypothetical protein